MISKKTRDCEIVQDLLPLYIDDIVSDGSREYIEEHLKECEECKKMKSDMEDSTVEKALTVETEGVLRRHKKKEQTLAWKLGMGIAFLLLLPIVITFLVTVTQGGDMLTFLLTAAGMACVAGLTSVPLLSTKHKFANTILVTTAAILLILFLLHCVDGGWFLVTAVPTVFGLSLPFFPFVIRAYPLPGWWKNQKALTTMLWDTVWAYLTLFVSTTLDGDYMWFDFISGCKIMTAFMIPIWLVFLVARYTKVNRWEKAGMISLIISVCVSVIMNPGNQIANGETPFFIMPNFSNWTNYQVVNANIGVIVFGVGAILGVLLLSIGYWKKK